MQPLPQHHENIGGGLEQVVLPVLVRLKGYLQREGDEGDEGGRGDEEGEGEELGLGALAPGTQQAPAVEVGVEAPRGGGCPSREGGEGEGDPGGGDELVSHSRAGEEEEGEGPPRI